MKSHHFIILVTLLITSTLTLVFSTLAFAQESSCDYEAINSPEWNSAYKAFSENYKLGLEATDPSEKSVYFKKSIAVARTLEDICNTSPTLLYSIGEVYLAQDDKLNATKYLREATKHISEFDLQQSIIDKIWFQYADLESPTRAELDIASKTSSELQEKRDDLYTAHKNTLTALQWSGTGIASGFGALAIVSSILWGVFEANENDATSALRLFGRNQINRNTSNNQYSRGNARRNEAFYAGLSVGSWVAAAAGVGIAITAAVQIRKLSLIDDPTGNSANDVTLGVNVSPMNAALSLTF